MHNNRMMDVIISGYRMKVRIGIVRCIRCKRDVRCGRKTDTIRTKNMHTRKSQGECEHDERSWER